LDFVDVVLLLVALIVEQLGQQEYRVSKKAAETGSACRTQSNAKQIAAKQSKATKSFLPVP